MGEAKRKADVSDMVSVLVPERGRPEELDRLLMSLIDTAGDENYEIIVYIDADDPAWHDREPRMHSHVRYLRRPRPPTLGEKLNWLAKEARGGILWFIANDMIVETRDWPGWFRRTAERLPNGIGIMHPVDMTNPGLASYFAMTRAMYEGVGLFAPPWFPYWFCDTWWTEIGILTGTLREVPVILQAPEGGQRSERPDLAFWCQVFEKTRPMRLRDSIQLMQVAFGENPPGMAMLEERHRLCAARTAHHQTDEFLRQWGTHEVQQTEQYAEVKAIAEKLVAELDAQTPRRVRVAICVPSGRTWEAATALSVSAISAYTAMAGVETGHFNVQTSLICHARNSTVDTVLTQGTFDYLFWMDSDMEVPPDALIRLLKHNKDIVGATYNKRTPRDDGTYETLGRLVDNETSDLRSGVHEAALLPGGMLLVKADVYRKMPKPWYATCYLWPGDTGKERFKAMMRDYFNEPAPDDVLEKMFADPEVVTWAEAGVFQGAGTKIIGEDIYWCRKARNMGYRLWCDLDLTFQINHLATHKITCLPKPEEVELEAAAD